MLHLRRALPLLAAFALALGYALFALNGAWQDPQHWLVGNWVHPDCLSNHWLLTWVAERVASGQSVLHNDAYYWPVGDAPVLAGNGGEGFVYLPFYLIFGWPVGVLWYSLTVLTCNGVAAWALARAAGGGRWSSLLGTVVVGCFPFLFQELGSGRFSQVSVFWVLFFLAAWLRFLEKPGLARAVGSALLLAAASFFYWYYGFFGVLAGAVLLAVRGRAGPGLHWLSIFSAAYLAFIGPWAFIFFRAWSEIPGTGETTLFPHPETFFNISPPDWPFLVTEGLGVGQAMAGTSFAVGVAGAVWVAVGWARRQPGQEAARGLLLVAILFYGLSLGPIAGLAPYNLIYRWAEPLRRFWWPMRHVILWQPAVAALGAVGLHALVGRIPREALRPWAEALLVGALAWAAPWLLVAQGARADVSITQLTLPPPVYTKIADLPGDVLVEAPVAPQAASAQQTLIYQRYHHKTLLGGHALWVDRVRPAKWDEFVAANSFLSEMQRLERGELSDTFSFEGADLQRLLDDGAVWYSVNRELFPFSFRELVTTYKELFDDLFGRPVAQGSGHWIWDGRTWTGQTELKITPFVWPEQVKPAGPSQPLLGRRPASPVFGTGRGGHPIPGSI